MEELKPCPFCGSANVKHTYTFCDEHYVKCNICGAEGAVAFTEKDAVIAWNTRV